MSKLDELYLDIKNECINLIASKKVDMEELSFKMGLDTKKMKKLFESRNQDFSLYLKLYDILLLWR